MFSTAVIRGESGRASVGFGNPLVGEWAIKKASTVDSKNIRMELAWGGIEPLSTNTFVNVMNQHDLEDFVSKTLLHVPGSNVRKYFFDSSMWLPVGVVAGICREPMDVIIWWSSLHKSSSDFTRWLHLLSSLVIGLNDAICCVYIKIRRALVGEITN